MFEINDIVVVGKRLLLTKNEEVPVPMGAYRVQEKDTGMVLIRRCANNDETYLVDEVELGMSMTHVSW